MAVRSASRQELVSELNVSERARQMLAPTVVRLFGQDARIGYQVESIFTTFWQLARKADDMMDYSDSSDLKWLQVLQQIFRLCSKVQDLPHTLPAKVWLKTTGRFFDLMSKTCEGEVEDLLLAGSKPLPGSYYKMALLKTGPWFTGRIECAALAAGGEPADDLLEYGNLTSVAYQIRNDIKDMEIEGKDIAIGKLNYPMILLLQNPLLSKAQAIKTAARTSDLYEQKAIKIARRHGSELELLTTQLCSSN